MTDEVIFEIWQKIHRVPNPSLSPMSKKSKVHRGEDESDKHRLYKTRLSSCMDKDSIKHMNDKSLDSFISLE